MTVDTRSVSNAGGAAGASGLNFQALATAVCMTRITTGRRLDWLERVEIDIPIAVSAETGGPGDDIMVELPNGHMLEVQVKRGLTKGSRLWDALCTMTTGLHDNPHLWAVLLVSADSSATIRNDLCRDLPRMASGRMDGLKSISKEFKTRTEALGQDVVAIAERLRIVTMDDDHAREIMRRDLEVLCATTTEARQAALTLEEDAKTLIERRGRRDLRTIVQALTSAEISLTHEAAMPAAALGRLTSWTMENTVHFDVLGAEKRLSVEDAWLPLKVVKATTGSRASNLAEALRHYHEGNAPDRDASEYDIEWLGRFVRRCVVEGGPGSGKSLASMVIARRYASDGYPVLQIRLSQVAARLRSGGGMEEAIWTLGLDGSGVNRSEAEALKSWVLIADGLDECGSTVDLVAEELARVSTGHPDWRIIVTTRPIGYDTRRIETWQHYRIAPMEESTMEDGLRTLIAAIEETSKASQRVDLSRDGSKDLRASLRNSPLLLALTAALLAAGRSLSDSRTQLYKAMLLFAERSGRARMSSPTPSVALRHKVLDLLGEKVIADPLASATDVDSFVRESLAREMSKPPLALAEDAERAIAYWLDIGLFERVRHLDHEAYTFVHRTFAEFVAARHLVAISQTEPETVQGRLSDAAWAEVIAFAARLGMAEVVVEHLLRGTHQPALAARRIRQALEIAGAPEVTLSSPLIDTLAQRACDLIRTGRRDIAVELGAALQGAANRYPQPFRTHVEPLGTLPSNWARTVALAVLASAAPTDQDLQASLAHLTAVPELVEERQMYPLGVISLERNPTNLTAQFLFATTTLVLDRLQKDEAMQALGPILSFRENLTVGFAMRLDALLDDHGLTEWRKDRPSTLDHLANRFTFRRSDLITDSIRRTFGALIHPDRLVADVVPLAEGEVLVELSGLVEATHLMELPLSSIIGGNEPSDIAAAQHVFHAIAALSSLDAETLEMEARQLDAAYRHDGEEDRLLHRSTRRIDVPEPRWDAAVSLNLDPDLLEAAICRGSGWIARNAGPLLQYSVPMPDLAARLQRLLQTATGDGLAIAATIATTLEPEEAVPLLCDAIEASEGGGRAVLFHALGQLRRWDERIKALCEDALLGRSVQEAETAAALLRTLAPAEPALGELANHAYRYWQEHEDPYPANGGVVPPSPRKDLLAVRIRCGIAAHTLMDAAVDSRSDVRSAALTELVARVAQDPATRTLYTTKCLDGTLGTEALRRLFQDDTPDAAIVVDTLIPLLQDADGERRYLALHLLNERFLPRSLIIQECERLLADPLDEIRRRAEYILSTLETKV